MPREVNIYKFYHIDKSKLSPTRFHIITTKNWKFMKTLHLNGKHSNSRPQNRGMDQSNLKLEQKHENQSKAKQNPNCILVYGSIFGYKPNIWFVVKGEKGKGKRILRSN